MITAVVADTARIDQETRSLGCVDDRPVPCGAPPNGSRCEPGSMNSIEKQSATSNVTDDG